MLWGCLNPFESGVNPEGIQTEQSSGEEVDTFESGVNPEGIQTGKCGTLMSVCLRVV